MGLTLLSPRCSCLAQLLGAYASPVHAAVAYDHAILTARPTNPATNFPASLYRSPATGEMLPLHELLQRRDWPTERCPEPDTTSASSPPPPEEPGASTASGDASEAAPAVPPQPPTTQAPAAFAEQHGHYAGLPPELLPYRKRVHSMALGPAMGYPAVGYPVAKRLRVVPMEGGVAKLQSGQPSPPSALAFAATPPPLPLQPPVHLGWLPPAAAFSPSSGGGVTGNMWPTATWELARPVQATTPAPPPAADGVQARPRDDSVESRLWALAVSLGEGDGSEGACVGEAPPSPAMLISHAQHGLAHHAMLAGERATVHCTLWCARRETGPNARRRASMSAARVQSCWTRRPCRSESGPAQPGAQDGTCPCCFTNLHDAFQ